MLVHELGRFIAERRYEDLPSSVVELVKMRVLDLLGAGMAGFRLGLYRPLFDILGGREEATVWGEGVKYPLRDAVLLNSFMAHSTYQEDGARMTGGHPASAVIPGALSLGETKRSSGKEFILSIALGYDVFIRLGKAIFPSSVVRGFQSTPVLGALGSAAACASLLKLDSKGSKNALAIACNLGVGLKEALRAPTSQPIQVGRSSEGGVLSALFAEKGVSGCDTILENGFLKAFADQPNEREILSNMGEKYLIEETYVKMHGGDRINHAPIDVILDLKRKYAILPQDIKEMRVNVDSRTMAEQIQNPMNGRQAQFSISFSIAVAVLEGNASFHQFTDEKVMDSRVRSMMGKVIVEVDKTMDKEYPKKRGAYGKILLMDGRQFSSQLDIPYGEPEFPVSVQEIERKFFLLTQDMLGKKVEEIRDQVMDLERLKDISELIQKLGL